MCLNVLGAFGGVWDRFGAFGLSWGGLERLNAFRALRERMGAFVRLGRLGRLVSIIPYVRMVCMYVA